MSFIRHDLKCGSCEFFEGDVFCRRDPDTMKAVIPSCPKCGADRSWIPTHVQVPSTSRREPPPDVKEHFSPGRGGFAQKTSTERLQDHYEARRKGDPGNQAEFADVMPLSDHEARDAGLIDKTGQLTEKGAQ